MENQLSCFACKPLLHYIERSLCVQHLQPYFYFFCSSLLIFFLQYIPHSTQLIQWVVISNLIVLGLLVISCIFIRRLRYFIFKRLRWPLLVYCNLVIQLLILYTGAVYSPFFILYHLAALGVALIFTFNIAVVFLGLSLVNIISFTLLNLASLSALHIDTMSLVFYGISFITGLPVIYFLTTRSHLKDVLSQMLTNEVNVQESISAGESELVFITDRQLRIISVNDAVERALQRSRNELYNKPLFDAVLIRDTNGKLLNEETPEIADVLKSQGSRYLISQQLLRDIVLSNTRVPIKRVLLQLKPIKDFDGHVEQISFIINTGQEKTDTTVIDDVKEIMVNHEAYIQKAKEELLASPQLHDVGIQLLSIAKVDQDIRTLLMIKGYGIEEKKVRIDLAKACRELVAAQQSFAKACHVEVNFSTPDFTEKDIAPYMTKLFPVTPDQFTGPFFTVACDVKYVMLLIQKLLEVGILLASSEENSFVNLTVEREGTKAFRVTVTAQCPQTVLGEEESLLRRLYGSLRGKTNLQLGSGFEGYLARKISDALNIPIKLTTASNPPTCTFSFTIKK